MCLSLRTALRRVLTPSTCARYSTRSGGQSRIYKFTSTLRDYISRGPDENKVETFVHRRLDAYHRSPYAPYKIFEPTISLLINQNRFLAATSVCARMIKSGLIPSLGLSAKLLAMAITMSPEKENVAISGILEGMFSDPHFSESMLEEALQVMIALGAPRKLIIDTIENFIETKSEDYTPGKFLLAKLVDAQVRNDRLGEALETLAEYEEAVASTSDTSDSTSAQVPYVAIMSAIRDTETWNSAAVNQVLEIMRTNNIQPSTAVFNVLISNEVRKSSLYNAFSIYAILKVMADNVPTVVPDAYTFGSLFNALCRMYKPEARNKKVQKRGGTKDEANIILSPRRLFFDMIQRYHDQPRLLMTEVGARPPKPGSTPPPTSTLPAPPPFEPNPTLLNLTFRCFIRARDYAAAIVAISSFRDLEQNVTPRTYYIILKHIMNRIRWDIKRHRMPGESRWGDRFLGVFPHTIIWQMDVDERLAKRVLEYVKGDKFDVKRGLLEGAPWAEVLGKKEPASSTPPKRVKGLRKDKETDKFITPTFGMMEDDEPVPAGTRFSAIPLMRLLQRALWAEVTDPQVLNGVTSSRPLSNAIEQAKSEMVPR